MHFIHVTSHMNMYLDKILPVHQMLICHREDPIVLQEKEPQYMGLFYHVKGEGDVLDFEAVSSVVQRDECFLVSMDLNETTDHDSSAMKYLDRDSYVTSDGTIEGLHPYAFSAKVQTHSTDNPTYKDILRLPEEERKLWDVAMVKELKRLRDLGSFKMVSRPKGANILASTWDFKKKRYPDGLLKKSKARLYVRGDQ